MKSKIKQIYAGFENGKLKNYLKYAKIILFKHNKTEGNF